MCETRRASAGVTRGARAALFAVVVACGGTGILHPREALAQQEELDASVHRDTARVRAATAAFRSLDAAVEAGYPRTVTGCLSNPELGGMGHHHAKSDLMDDNIELERPEILVYTPTEDGEYTLHGVEYIVPYSARPPEAEPPTVMGQELKRADGLQIWYLHVWVWTPNPSGLFADWNPDVKCES
ncbi:MAG: hypothetical protein ACREM1_22340 [Longimicrobiales bacterium]